VQLDVSYAETRNVLLDLKILFGSIPAILLKRGAY
jgi:lipopolysaccharide/colanic/teichoic acid biosynthesis glycosyltransferase